MRSARTFVRPSDQGYALLTVLVSTSAALLVLASVMKWTGTIARIADRNNLFTLSSAAAEGATECVMANMSSDFYNQDLQSASSYMSTNLLPNISGWPVQFSFSNPSNTSAGSYVSVFPVNWTTNWSVLFGTNAAGLHAFIAHCTATSTATTIQQPYRVSAGVQLQFELAAIPVFQYAIFYNMNLEIDPGATMTVNGPVFSNGGIWVGSPLAGLNSSVQAVGIISTATADPFSSGYTGGGGPAYGTLWTSNTTSVALPIGTTNDPVAVRALLNLPPNGVSPYSAAGQKYYANEADLIISNSASGVISAFFQNTNSVQPVTSIPYDVVQIKSGTTNYSYSFATNVSFYDYRESKTVAAVQLNVGALNSWISSSNGNTYNSQLHFNSGHYIDSVYVYNNAPASSTKLPSVRVANGSILPSQGLTVVTPDPLYVLGNYNANGTSLNNGTNVANTVPAALIGDAITLLSSNWNDQLYTSGYALSSRTPTNTTVNAATYEGIVPTVGANYSGGVENFVRLLENWGTSTPLTYNGSIVVMFPSQYATNHWQQTGNYYNAPKRIWAFDVNFETQNGLPPLTPELRTVYRQSWTGL